MFNNFFLNYSLYSWDKRRTHIYIHKYVRTYIHAYTHTQTQTYVHTYIHTYNETDIQSFISFRLPSPLRTHINVASIYIRYIIYIGYIIHRPIYIYSIINSVSNCFFQLSSYVQAIHFTSLFLVKKCPPRPLFLFSSYPTEALHFEV